MVNVKNVGKSTTRYCKCGFELGGSFVGKPPQPKCPASVDIFFSKNGREFEMF